ncbi:Histone-lysine N-methyltransferase ehmt1 [Ascochyta clinopodiicola]|nr:Histone-lysine N-methyltransferase ehmt1 [Ascochyta clinopodiicola]
MVKFPATPENIKCIRFDPGKWQNVTRPTNYHGPWPPTSASQLLNTDFTIEDMGGNRAAKYIQKRHGEQINEECLGKFCWQRAGLPNGIYCLEANCDHTFTEWLTGQVRWRERFEIRTNPGMGYGLYSKANPRVGWNGTWKKTDILGAYLGELLPARNENTDYCHEVTIGPEFQKTSAPVAYIDSEKYGNHVRFCNHSCESNAKILEARVGKERVLALRATTWIKAGEQIRIDYGDDYFRCRQCLCGSEVCKYPNAVNVGTPAEAPRSASRKTKKKSRSGESKVDAVFDMDVDLEVDTKSDQ